MGLHINIHAGAIEAVLAGDVLPEGRTNLVTALTGLEVNLYGGKAVSALAVSCCG